jgi:hypothetical protein
LHVPVSKSELLGLAEPDAVDDGGVVQLVGNDDVVGSEELLENSGVGVEAAGVQDGVVATVKVGYFSLEFLKMKSR